MTDWNGFRCESFEFEGMEAHIVFPKENCNGKLALKTEYWNAFPNAIEIPMVEAGYHLCFVKNKNRWGTDEDINRKARFVRFVQERHNLSEKCVPVGMSCGGLMAIKFTAAYPEVVSCLYLDAPVVNYMSCPCGFGVGEPLNEDYSEILDALSFNSISELLAYREMPLDKLPILVKNRVPVVMVAGDSDKVVPYCENGILLQKKYEKAGIDFSVHIKMGCDHHPHGLDDPEEILRFILNHSK